MASRAAAKRRRQVPVVSLERPRPLGDCVAEDCRLPADRAVLIPGAGLEPVLCGIHADAAEQQIARNLRHKTERELGLA